EMDEAVVTDSARSRSKSGRLSPANPARLAFSSDRRLKRVSPSRTLGLRKVNPCARACVWPGSGDMSGD
ncbi:MAG: hypothetical protein KJS91_15690, partial [Planctomycetes bacterium]|nr:hypothetical protein [Planctomycetota bacterium]